MNLDSSILDRLLMLNGSLIPFSANQWHFPNGFFENPALGFFRQVGVSGDLGASGSKNLKLSVFSKEEIQHIIKNGKDVMPAYNDILNSDQKVSDISDHVLSLRD